MPEIIPKVTTDGKKIWFDFIFPQTSLDYPTDIPEDKFNEHVLHRVHAAAVVKASQLLNFATGLKYDAKVEISRITPTNN